MRNLQISASITHRETPSLSRYLFEVNKEPLLDVEEEVKLIKKIKEGDINALEALIKANLRFVIAIAKKYQHQGLSFHDLISEGNIGMIEATGRFDETRGFKFISYAVWWIRKSILRALAEHSRIVRLPQNKAIFLQKINDAFTRLEQEFAREPTIEELALALNARQKEVLAIIKTAAKKISLDAPLSDKEQSLLDVFRDPNSMDTDHEISFTESLQFEINTMLKTLSCNQAKVIRLYYGIGIDEPLTLVDIGQIMNFSSERVRQIKEEALIRIKNAPTANYGRIIFQYINKPVIK